MSMRNDELSLNIDQMLPLRERKNIHQRLQEFSHTASTPSIYRVSDSLRSTNEKAYDPIIIAIGPFHRGKGHLEAMEHLKMRYLKELVRYSGVYMYVDAIRSREQDARDFYAENIGLNVDEFVEMLLLDGVFIIEFLREYNKLDKKREVVSKDNNPIFGFGHVVNHILRDLMLLENQIPLFVLENLFNLSWSDGQDEFNSLFWPLLSSHSQSPVSMESLNAYHLLGLVHSVRCSSFVQILKDKDVNRLEKNIHSAVELKEAGIVFKKLEKNDKTSWLDITFKNRMIYIPKLEISDVSESWFRNMIAYEYYFSSSSPKYITDYAFFLHCLMISSKDAELLRRCGVISNWLGGDTRVYEVIDRLGTNVQPSEYFSYYDVFRSINDHCKLKRNRWLAVLRRHHFNNPWTAISMVAAAVLLSVGIVQMVFAVLTFYRDV